ncbi:hypothetical protein COV05_00495 [Candidatus Uhrbacteria bacterium CG10_big_fil_rev_8_21_14_0_10_48_16]|uniref:DUF948 domain-containing protein n=1 Tax=Candidatus Uhrbacteria bacterium CG10_big_fil_rev_8_21_14_0_10_48_16 TaxID=1975038 RepID=A0A2M8LID6_9BACT|nr:MAG: hypothetical protein COV05_00495 [Candidatus Uhrbacteria bacterium CG10_big_fil_rev_8_21_14_0_10_48_16]
MEDMFTPLEILYIVLAFCALWLSAIVFWLLWQVANVLKRINDTVSLAQETLAKMEEALDGIRKKFDSTSTALGAVLHTATRAVEYLVEKRMMRQETPKKTARTRKK